MSIKPSLNHVHTPNTKKTTPRQLFMERTPKGNPKLSPKPFHSSLPGLPPPKKNQPLPPTITLAFSTAEKHPSPCCSACTSSGSAASPKSGALRTLSRSSASSCVTVRRYQDGKAAAAAEAGRISDPDGDGEGDGADCWTTSVRGGGAGVERNRRYHVLWSWSFASWLGWGCRRSRWRGCCCCWSFRCRCRCCCCLIRRLQKRKIIRS